MAQYVLQPGNHTIIIPSSSYNIPKDIHRFLLGMASSLRELLSIHDNSRGESADLILEAFEHYLSSVSPRYDPLRQFELYSTHEVKNWQYSLWIIHRLRYFIQDKPKLIHRIIEVRKAHERESVRKTEASKYWDDDMMVESFGGVGSDASSGTAGSLSFADVRIEGEDFSPDDVQATILPFRAKPNTSIFADVRIEGEDHDRVASSA